MKISDYLTDISKAKVRDEAEKQGMSTSAGGEGKQAEDTQHDDLSGSQDLLCTESVEKGIDCLVW